MLVVFGLDDDGQAARGADQAPALVSLPLSARVTQVSCGSRHTLCLDAAGQVYSWGWGVVGQLGLGSPATVEEPTPVPGLRGAQVSAGGMHSAVLDAEGALCSFGENTYGQLGLGEGDAENRFSPEPVALRGVAQVSCGGLHTAAVLASGELYAWGRGDSGQLGVGSSLMHNAQDIVAAHEPTRVAGLRGVARVACGAFHTAAVDREGRVFAWGKYDYGMLGSDEQRDQPEPKEVGGLGRAASDVACGGWHTMVVGADGAVLAFGRGEMGRLGLGEDSSHRKPARVPSLEGIRAVACGGTHSVFVSASHEVFVCGRADNGRLGAVAEGSASTPRLVAMPEACAGLSVVDVSCGGAHSAVVLQ